MSTRTHHIEGRNKIPYQKTIFMMVSRGSTIRNFFQTGIVPQLLEEGVRVVILSMFPERRDIWDLYSHDNLIIEPLRWTPDGSVTRRIMQEFFKGAMFNRTIHTRHIYRVTASQVLPSKLWYLPRILFFAPFRFVPGFKAFIRFVDIHVDPQKENDYLFEKYHPDLVFSTSPLESTEGGVLKGAKRFGVKTISMPKSWDNLSKRLFSVKTDSMIVWGPFMRGEATKYQGYIEKEVIMTGAPQFDWYTDKKNLLSREQFCKQNSLDPNKKIILYGSSGSNSCHENHYTDFLRKLIELGQLGNVQMFIRPHVGYLGDRKRFEYLEGVPNIVIDNHDVQDSRLKDNWDISKEHPIHLYNSLFHADVCVNIASSLSIDATMCGTPVINIGFDLQKVDVSMTVKRLYKSIYVDAIVESGGTWVTKSKEDFMQALMDILVVGRQKKEGMQRLIEYLALNQDGRAVRRVVGHILKTLKQT